MPTPRTSPKPDDGENANLAAAHYEPKASLSVTVNFDSSGESTQLNASAVELAPDLSGTQLEGQKDILSNRISGNADDHVTPIGLDGLAKCINPDGVGDGSASDASRDILEKTVSSFTEDGSPAKAAELKVLLNQTVDFSSDRSQSQARYVLGEELEIVAESSEDGSEHGLSDPSPAGELDGHPAANSSLLLESDHAAEAELDTLRARIQELESRQKGLTTLNLELSTRLETITAAAQPPQQAGQAEGDGTEAAVAGPHTDGLDGDPAAKPGPDHAAEAELKTLRARIQELESQIAAAQPPQQVGQEQAEQAEGGGTEAVAPAPAPFVSTRQRLQQLYEQRNGLVNGIKKDELLAGRENILNWAIEDLQEILELYAAHLKMPALQNKQDLTAWREDMTAANADDESDLGLRAKKQAVIELYEASGVPLKTFNANADVRGNYTTYQEYARDRLKAFQAKVVEKTAILDKDRDMGRLVLAGFASLFVLPAVVWAIGSKINRDSFNIFASHGNALRKKSTDILDDVAQQGINLAA